MAGHLNEGGVLVQWVQLYEIDFDSVASIHEGAVAVVLGLRDVYRQRKNILIVAARNGGSIGDIDETAYMRPVLHADLMRWR